MSGATAPIPVGTLNGYFIELAIPTSIIIPWGGNVEMIFAPNPTSMTAVAAKVNVTIIPLGVALGAGPATDHAGGRTRPVPDRTCRTGVAGRTRPARIDDDNAEPKPFRQITAARALIEPASAFGVILGWNPATLPGRAVSSGTVTDTEDCPNDESWATEIAIQLVEHDIDENWPHSASGRHRKGRSTVRGQGPVHAALMGLGAQISDVVTAVSRQLEAVNSADPGPHKLRPETVELTFGVTFKAGTGKIVETVLMAGGESSAQIKLVLSRGARDGGE